METSNSQIEIFFHTIGPKILDLVATNRKKNAVILQKVETIDSVDFATEMDVAVEELIVKTIKEKFPTDAILAEEKNSHTSLEQQGRIWIIDPICGTANFSRGLPLYVSNIALAENGKLVASCIVDHLFGKYFWSIGSGVYQGTELIKIEKKYKGTIVDIDLGALISAPQEVKNRYAKFVDKFIRETDISCVGLNTSLSFLFVVTGIYDGFVTPWVHTWDIAASLFLIQQVGGVVTDIDGNSWKLNTPNAVVALDPNLHTRLIKVLQKTKV
jgi:myo-inositol-1(or 4)-monophosphatase